MPVLPEFSLSGRVAVFATAGGDEGPLLASALAEGGATVFVVARTQRLLNGVMGALGDGGHGGVASALESAAEVERVMGELEGLHGGADILVNDPRSFFAKPLAEITWEEWEEVQARNLRSAFMLCQAVGKRMVDQGYGRIVNVVSVMAERGVINCSAYAATQAGLLSLTRTMAVEWGRPTFGPTPWGSDGRWGEIFRWKSSKRSYWCGIPRFGGKGILGILGGCWCICVRKPAIMRRGRRFTWMGG